MSEEAKKVLRVGPRNDPWLDISVNQEGQVEIDNLNPDEITPEEIQTLLNALTSGPFQLRKNDRSLLPDRMRIETQVEEILPDNPNWYYAVHDAIFYGKLAEIIDPTTPTHVINLADQENS